MIRKQPIKKTNQVKVTFVLPADHPHADSSVVGEFNDWDPTANPLRKRSNNTYSAAVVLDAGKRYAFRYIHNGETYFNDEAADAYEPSGFGTENSVVTT